jgi:hypothetical protein
MSHVSSRRVGFASSPVSPPKRTKAAPLPSDGASAAGAGHMDVQPRGHGTSLLLVTTAGTALSAPPGKTSTTSERVCVRGSARGRERARARERERESARTHARARESTREGEGGREGGKGGREGRRDQRRPADAERAHGKTRCSAPRGPAPKNCSLNLECLALSCSPHLNPKPYTLNP